MVTVCCSYPAFSWLPVILGVVSAVVVLIVVIVLAVCKCNMNRLSDVPSDVDRQVYRYSTSITFINTAIVVATVNIAISME